MIEPHELRIGAKYHDTRLGLVGRAWTYPPPVPEPFTTLDVTGRGQFGGGTYHALLADLILWEPPDVTDPAAVEEWLDA